MINRRAARAHQREDRVLDDFKAALFRRVATVQMLCVTVDCFGQFGHRPRTSGVTTEDDGQTIRRRGIEKPKPLAGGRRKRNVVDDREIIVPVAAADIVGRDSPRRGRDDMLTERLFVGSVTARNYCHAGLLVQVVDARQYAVTSNIEPVPW